MDRHRSGQTAHYAGSIPPLDVRNQLLAWAAGVIAAHWLPNTHPFWPYLLLGGVGLLPLRRWRLAAAALLGLGWGAYNAVDAVARRIDANCAEAHVSGRIVGLPSRRSIATPAGELHIQSFVLMPEGGEPGELNGCERSEARSARPGLLLRPHRKNQPLDGAMRLTWFDGPLVSGGERWRLRLRIKPPRGTANAHAFDRDRWLLQNRLSATGYVIEGARLATRASSIDALRETLRERLRRVPLVNTGVVAALALGDAAAIPAEQMDRYRRTGTMHLLVISGLHVGIVTALGFFLGRWIGLLAGVPAKACGAVVALLLAGGYVLLGGAGLALLRAFAMSATALLALLAGRSTAPSAVFAYALAIVLAVDAMAPLATGFWLSFGAVAVLLAFFAPRRRPRSWLISAVLAQLAIAAAFTPLTVQITGLVHPLSTGVNLVVTPVVTLLAIPLALAGSVALGFSMDSIGVWLLTGADFSIAVVGEVLQFADRLAPLYVADPGLWMWWLLGAAAACLLPVARLALAALVTTAAAMLLLPSLRGAEIPHGEVDIAVLDVGQGTAVLVQTSRHVLLYDAGPAFRGAADSGASVVLPSLRGRGIGAIDVLVLSHGDLDHIGGAATVLAGTQVRRSLAGEPVAGVAAAPCRTGTSWQWDGVLFSVLHPSAELGYSGNNASCVVLIETASARALLAGDIERLVEKRLDAPAVDLLLVPHHGSLTSSSVRFVAATRPRFAVVTAGFRNRFGHPHPLVLERYRDVGAHIVSTAAAGAVRWSSARPGAIGVQRGVQSPYWRLKGYAAPFDGS